MADDEAAAEAADDLKALAQRCVPDPTLERFFRDDEPDDGGPHRGADAAVVRHDEPRSSSAGANA